MSHVLSTLSSRLGQLQKIFENTQDFEDKISKARLQKTKSKVGFEAEEEIVHHTSHSFHGEDWDDMDVDDDEMDREPSRKIFPKLNGRWAICDRMWMFLEEPSSSLGARLYGAMMMAFILVSVILSLILSTHQNVNYVDITFDTVFTLEFIARICVCPKVSRFLSNFHNLVDLASVTPFFIRLALGFKRAPKGSALELVLLHRPILRLMKTTRNFSGFQLLVRSLAVSSHALPVPLFMLLLMVMSFSSLMYWVEPRDSIKSMPHAMWFSLVTISTVGYGDTLPRTTAGKLFTTVFIICGVLYMAMPISIVGRNFTTVWQERDKILLMKKVRSRLVDLGYSSDNVLAAFEAFDTFGKGEVGMEDFRRMSKELQLGISEERNIELFQLFDSDGSGAIAFSEFCAVIFPNTVLTYNKFRKNSLQAAKGDPGGASSFQMKNARKSNMLAAEMEKEKSKANASKKGTDMFGGRVSAARKSVVSMAPLSRSSVGALSARASVTGGGNRKSVSDKSHRSSVRSRSSIKSHGDLHDEDSDSENSDDSNRRHEDTLKMNHHHSDHHSHQVAHPPPKHHFHPNAAHGGHGGMWAAPKHHNPTAGLDKKHHKILGGHHADHGHHPHHGHHPPVQNLCGVKIGRWLDVQDEEVEAMHLRVDALAEQLKRKGIIKNLPIHHHHGLVESPTSPRSQNHEPDSPRMGEKSHTDNKVASRGEGAEDYLEHGHMNMMPVLETQYRDNQLRGSTASELWGGESVNGSMDLEGLLAPGDP